jgi:hypothetical protein
MGALANPFAFPSPACGDWSPEYGMTLRDWFAGQAPITIRDAVTSCSGRMFIDVPADRAFLFKVLSTLRYEYADAMLAERAKGGAE